VEVLHAGAPPGQRCKNGHLLAACSCGSSADGSESSAVDTHGINGSLLCFP